MGTPKRSESPRHVQAESVSPIRTRFERAHRISRDLVDVFTTEKGKSIKAWDLAIDLERQLARLSGNLIRRQAAAGGAR